MSFNKTVPFINGYSIEIDSQSPAFKEVTFILTGPFGTCDATINALWKPNMFNQVSVSDRFQIGDYFEQTIAAHPPGKESGPILHDFIIEYKDQFPFPLINFYSTKDDEDGYELNEFGKRFWQKRVKQGKAEYVNAAGRFRILWK